MSRDILNQMLFAIGSEEEQSKMIPQKIKRVKHYETRLHIKAGKDISKGENIVVPVSITLPAIEQEVIAEVSKKLEVSKDALKYKKSNIITP